MTTQISKGTAADAALDALYGAILSSLCGRTASDRHLRDIALGLAAAWGAQAAPMLQRQRIVIDLWWDDDDCTCLDATLDGYTRLSARINARGIVIGEISYLSVLSAGVAA